MLSGIIKAENKAECMGKGVKHHSISNFIEQKNPMNFHLLMQNSTHLAHIHIPEDFFLV